MQRPQAVTIGEVWMKVRSETAQPANVTTTEIVCGDPKANPNDLVGYGIVDAYAAVKEALAKK